MEDPFMYARSAALLEFCCPPLPIANGKRIETDEPVVINSHDLLSIFLAQAFKMQNAEFNATRQKKQEAIEEAYYKGLLASDGSPDNIYALMAQYTREYLGTYLLPPMSERDVCVLPPDHISPPLLSQIRSYHNAMHIVQYSKPTDSPSDLAGLLCGCHKMLCERESKHSP